jgi:hypothetical protein
MGEGVFIGLESSRRPTKVTYVRYYFIAVQMLFRMSRYYLKGISKSSIRLVLLVYVCCTIHIVQLYYLQNVHPVGDHCMFMLKESSVHPAFQHTSALKDKSVHPPTLAYVRTKRQTKRQIFKMSF